MIRFAAFLASNQHTKAWSIRGHRQEWRTERTRSSHKSSGLGWRSESADLDRSHRNCVGHPPGQLAYRHARVMFRSAIRAASTIADNNKRTDVGGSGTPEGDTA
jgi:hypothetical protein